MRNFWLDRAHNRILIVSNIIPCLRINADGTNTITIVAYVATITKEKD